MTGQETRFRHDRIRDFFTHFAFLDLSVDEVTAYAGDARFAGVYAYLARSLDASDAEALRERLIRQAAELDDHRVSDSFVREYDWRQRFGAAAPVWLSAHDLPEAADADADFRRRVTVRRELQAEIDADRNRIAAARALTCVLLAADPRDLLDRAGQVYLRAGARHCQRPDPKLDTVLRLTDPGGHPFFVAAVAQAEQITPIHLALALAQLHGAAGPRVLVTNSTVQIAPAGRPADLTPAMLEVCRADGVWPLEARRLYATILAAARSGEPPDWTGLTPPSETAP